MSTVLPAPSLYTRFSLFGWALLAVVMIVLSALLQSGIGHMFNLWGREEYSHAPLIPLISGYLIWQQRAAWSQVQTAGSWWGVTLVGAGLLLQILGLLATVDILQQYGLLAAIYGLVLALLGGRSLSKLWAPLLLLALMIPLPEFLLQNVSAQLQLVSSHLGVLLIRAFGISVFVEGNVIDLGAYRLQVAEACDGLRYLLPLMTLAFCMAYLFRAAFWKRALLFVSSIPVTIVMNSIRIGTIGVMVEHWGTGMAEGFVHDFQGWAVFMCSAGLLLLEMIGLARLGANPRPWRQAFGLDAQGAPSTQRAGTPARSVPPPFMVCTVMVAAFVVGTLLTPQRSEVVPQRELFDSFPAALDGRIARRSPLERIYLEALKLDDYVLADYTAADREPVNFYVAWYASQRAGQSAHSPRSCLPGGGWRITSLTQLELPSVPMSASPLRVNRAQIELGNQKQLVYYWFQQRGRVITNEYLVKWYLFWDSLTRRRTDGALVRLVTPLHAGESAAQADERLQSFLAQAAPRLTRYVPD
jgi:exosortase D (VPLPA-CTERM-specific)